jgi:hypothetical protein
MTLALGKSFASRATQLTILLGFFPRVDRFIATDARRRL